jgi:hypothetical protein
MQINLQNLGLTGPSTFSGAPAAPQTINVNTDIGSVALSGGVVLSNELNTQGESTIFATADSASSGAASHLDSSLTISFPQPVSNLGLTISDSAMYDPIDYKITSNTGASVDVASSNGTASIQLPSGGQTFTITPTGGPSGPAGWDYAISNVAFNYDPSDPLSKLPVGNNFTVADTSSGQNGTSAGTAYTGPVQGVSSQMAIVTTDSLNIVANVPNVFIHSGSGTDALDVSKAGGSNVLDGGTGSNFLVGGSGNDTFFVDDRGATADSWSTVNNFHAGDSATIWGVDPNSFALNWADGQGANGFTGLTLHATSNGKPTPSLTLVGYTTADLSNGRLSVSFGTDPGSGSPYMFVHAN